MVPKKEKELKGGYFIKNVTIINGPYTLEELKQKSLAANTRIWSPKTKQWHYARDLPELGLFSEERNEEKQQTSFGDDFTKDAFEEDVNISTSELDVSADKHTGTSTDEAASPEADLVQSGALSEQQEDVEDFITSELDVSADEYKGTSTEEAASPEADLVQSGALSEQQEDVEDFMTSELDVSADKHTGTLEAEISKQNDIEQTAAADDEQQNIDELYNKILLPLGNKKQSITSEPTDEATTQTYKTVITSSKSKGKQIKDGVEVDWGEETSSLLITKNGSTTDSKSTTSDDVSAYKPKIDSQLIPSILVFIFCNPIMGFFALIFAIMSSSSYSKMEYIKAKKYAQVAKVLWIIGIVSSIAFIIYIASE